MVTTILNLFEIDSAAKSILSLFLIVAFGISLWRQLLGFKDLGYLATIALAFFLTNLGWMGGILLVFLALTYVAIINVVLGKIVILKFPKDTLFIIFTILLTFITFNVLSWIFESSSNFNMSSIKIDLNAFIILALAVLVLKFKQLLTDKPLGYAINIIGQGAVPVILSLFLFHWNKFRLFTQFYFGLFLVAILICLILIGKYSGLRLVELLKYYKILKQEE